MLWPNDTATVGRFNTAVQELLLIIVNVLKLDATSRAHKHDLLPCLQSVLAIAVELCCYVGQLPPPPQRRHATGHRFLQLYRACVQLSVFVKELTLTIQSMLTSEQLELLLQTAKQPWLVALVCEQLLDSYDESLLPLVTDAKRTLTLQYIVSKCFFLLPPLTSSERDESPHKKLKMSDVDSASSSGQVNVHKYTCIFRQMCALYVSVHKAYTTCFFVHSIVGFVERFNG